MNTSMASSGGVSTGNSRNGKFTSRIAVRNSVIRFPNSQRSLIESGTASSHQALISLVSIAGFNNRIGIQPRLNSDSGRSTHRGRREPFSSNAPSSQREMSFRSSDLALRNRFDPHTRRSTTSITRSIAVDHRAGVPSSVPYVWARLNRSTDERLFISDVEDKRRAYRSSRKPCPVGSPLPCDSNSRVAGTVVTSIAQCVAE